MAVSIFQAILIFMIGVVLVAVAFPWMYNSLQQSIEISEIQTIRTEFGQCSDKLIETLNTGSPNQCLFSISKGRISVENALLYRLESSFDVCDQHDWSEIETYIYQKCDENGLTVYQLKWDPDIVIEGAGSGNSIIITRINSSALGIEFD